MAQYRKKVTKKGTQLFYRDNERVSKMDIPLGIRRKLQAQTRATDDLEPPYPPTKAELRKERDAQRAEEARLAPPPEKECIYDGTEAKLSRSVNGEMVYLCDEHYYSKSLGQVAQQLREVRSEGNSEE